MSQNNGGVSRISVSLPETLLLQLDEMVAERGFDSRSQAIAEMISHQITAHKKERGNEIMAGTITLLYDHSTPRLQKLLADLQHQHIREIISSLHVHLMHSQTMEVILVQGPAAQLQLIADKMITNRGVISGKLELTTTLIPQLHQ
ncbi:nickel-responsive transcriptional regulator NikR [Sinimarinibacterium sp. CAU 1509]|uniref:nickel-responsive transcriptional regulator NikR n=1 Tax=Sinimarinibacterium sp. CAU 1509 TaxID=2562283 RepID=UPI0010AB6DD7|nr:nickel-responsive transcriptional regulator NikR [Sinimarinibacterium sp. CAU 1509]TJY58370.1 nickel-responsive transcriptional regulator NikR [Sinimarinibacterium sp. CAU 1509]